MARKNVFVKRITVLLLAVAMAVSMTPALALADDAQAKTVTVTMRVQNGGQFIVPNETLVVEDGLAEEYGYEVKSVDEKNESIEDPTIFDALVAAHIAKYGEAFKQNPTDYLAISETNGVVKLFENIGDGSKTANIISTINKEQAHDDVLVTDSWGTNYTAYSIDSARIKDGDTIDVFSILDTEFWGDYYTFFEPETVNVNVGEEVTLTLKGYQIVYYGLTEAILDKAEPMYSEDGADGLIITLVDKSTGDQTVIEGKTTDKNGEVKLSFDQEGTYYVSAQGFEYNEYPIASPWATITVSTETPDVTPAPPTDSTPKVEKGKTYKVKGASYKVTKAGAAVTFKKAANKKSVSVPKTVKLKDGKSYKVTAVGAKAFTGKKIRTVAIGANVNKLAKGAFSKSKAKTMILKTKKLKKKTVKGSLKGSKINTIKVKVGSKKLNKKYKKAYKKIFTKKNAGKKVKYFK